MAYKFDVNGQEFHFCLSDFADLRADIVKYYQKNQKSYGLFVHNADIESVKLPKFRCTLSIFKLFEPYNEVNNQLEMNILEALPTQQEVDETIKNDPNLKY